MAPGAERAAARLAITSGRTLFVSAVRCASTGRVGSAPSEASAHQQIQQGGAWSQSGFLDVPARRAARIALARSSAGVPAPTPIRSRERIRRCDVCEWCRSRCAVRSAMQPAFRRLQCPATQRFDTSSVYRSRDFAHRPATPPAAQSRWRSAPSTSVGVVPDCASRLPPQTATSSSQTRSPESKRIVRSSLFATPSFAWRRSSRPQVRRHTASSSSSTRRIGGAGRSIGWGRALEQQTVRKQERPLLEAGEVERSGQVPG